MPQAEKMGVSSVHGPVLAEAAGVSPKTWQRWMNGHNAGWNKGRITVHPAATPTGQLPDGFRVEARHTRTVVTWP